jgi:acyl-coenzyme A thioesterase PaaI-like protein
MGNAKYRKLIGRINWYPPYLGAGIQVKSFDEDLTRFEVVLKPRWYTRNLFGTHFGGALYSMCDPFFVFIVLMNLGREFIVWDRSAGIEFLKPARGVITGVFEIGKERLAEIGQEVRQTGKNTYHFEADLTDANGQVVARVSKEVYVRLKATGDPGPSRS